MRGWLLSIAIAACASSPHATPAQPPPPPPAHQAGPPAQVVRHVHRPIVIAVLGLVADPPSAAQVAADLTLYLRNAAREDAHTQLAENREALDEELMVSCTNEAPACMAKIGGELHADYVLFGRVTGASVTLKLLDVARVEVRAWSGTVTPERAALEALAAGAYAELTATVP